MLIHWRSHTIGFWRKHTFLSNQGLGNPDSKTISIQCWAILNPITMLSCSPFLIYCPVFPSPKTLLRYTRSFYIAELFPISIPCLGRFCSIKLLVYSHFYHFADVYPVSLLCWAIPYLSALSNYALSQYIAVVNRKILPAANRRRVLTYPIEPEKSGLKCRPIFCKVSYNVSSCNAELLKNLWHCWTFPNFNSLQSYSQS